MKIIYGRAGTGKSEYIFEMIKEKLLSWNISEKNQDNKKKIYIITPEQFSFTAEKRLLEKLDNSATVNVEVLSFERMAYRVIKETMNEDIKQIGKAEKAMIIYEAVLNNQKDLQFLGKSLENIETIITQITEFKKHNITVEKLTKQAENQENQYLKTKLNDMLILYRELEDKIAEDLIDENDLLTVLSEKIEESHLFDNAIFYLDEFAGFTKQEYEVIRKLNKIGSELFVTVCTDDLRVIKSPESDIFYDNKQNVQTLCEIGDIERENQICLSNTYRFKNAELKHLEKNIFDIPYRVYQRENENIKLYMAENPYMEVEYVASEIVELVRNNNYRYRDVAIICNNLETYSSLCKVIFDEYDIPVFIDEKKDITQNVIIKFVLAIFDIYSKSWSYDAVFNYLKTGVPEIENIYELENYCLKWGIRGRKFYERNWSYDKYGTNYEQEQKQIIEPLLILKEKIDKNKTVENICEVLYNFIVESYNKSVENDGSMKNTENIEALNLITNVLEQMTLLYGDEKISFDHFSNLLKAGLSAKELGQIPQTQDKVIVGDVNRSKTHKVKAVFIIGVNDGVFPSIHNSEGFFNDKDRNNLKEQGFELAKGTREKMYEENFNIYKAFSTAEERLFVSYSSSDSEGKALRKSLLISKLKRIFKNIEEDFQKKDTILTPKITFSKLLNNIDNKEWKEVLEWYRKEFPEKLQKALNGLKYTNIASTINEENIEELYGKKLKTSVSRLEKYMSCPFSYFLQYGLKLSEKDKLEIKPIDTGSFMHEVVDSFFKHIKEKSINVKEINDNEISDIIEIIVNEKLQYQDKFNLTAKYRTLVQRLKRVLKISIKYIVQSIRESEFDVLATEAEFDSREGASYSPIEMELENGKRVSIIGKIDRIDIAKMPDGNYIRIIDYKSSTKDIDLNKVISGLQLQLLTYTDAICENENVLPAGALYYTLIEPKIAERKINKEEIEDIIKQNFRMNGLVLADINIIKAMDTTLDTGKSDKIPITLNANGEINFSRSKTITREEFENIQKYTNKIIKQISKEILSGNIEIKPYYNQKEKKTPCMYCTYKSICQFNSKMKNNDYRFIPNMKRQEIIEKMSQ